jgi:hypothetical protein
MKPSGPQIFTAFTSMPMRFASLLLIPACLLLPAPAGAAVLSTQTSLGTTANNNQTTPGQEVLLIAVVFTGGNLVRDRFLRRQQEHNLRLWVSGDQPHQRNSGLRRHVLDGGRASADGHF